ncbi:Xylose operon regulatory protein [compost metagenome]
MEATVLGCGYSYHMEKFHISRNYHLSSYLFRLQTEGNCEAYIDGRLQTVVAGDLLLYKPGDTYELQVDGQPDNPKISSGDYYLYGSGAWIEHWWGRTSKPTKCRIGLDDKLISLWRQLVLEQRRLEEEDHELSSYLLRALCIYLERASSENISMPSRTFTGTRMKRYIEEHAIQTFKIEEVASHVGLSVSRAVHLFKECFGKTMIQYSLEIRLSVAVERMKYSLMTLEQISQSCGFGSYPYFHRVFKEAYKLSPKDYRDRSMTSPSG